MSCEVGRCLQIISPRILLSCNVLEQVQGVPFAPTLSSIYLSMGEIGFSKATEERIPEGWGYAYGSSSDTSQTRIRSNVRSS